MTVTIEIPDGFIAHAKAAGDDPIALVFERLADLFADDGEQERPLQTANNTMTAYERHRVAAGLARIDAGIPGVSWETVLAKLEKNAEEAYR